MGSNLFGFFLPFLTSVQEKAAESGLARAIVVLTDKGILIRTAVTFVGVMLVIVGLVLLARKPVTEAAVKIGGAVL